MGNELVISNRILQSSIIVETLNLRPVVHVQLNWCSPLIMKQSMSAHVQSVLHKYHSQLKSKRL